MMMQDNKILWLDCDCHSPHHAIRIWHQSDDYYNDLVIEMQVNNYRSFWRRCIEAFKYVFNFKNKNCSYDAFNLHAKDVDSLMEILVEFKNTRDELIAKYEEKKNENCK